MKVVISVPASLSNLRIGVQPCAFETVTGRIQIQSVYYLPRRFTEALQHLVDIRQREMTDNVTLAAGIGQNGSATSEREGEGEKELSHPSCLEFKCLSYWNQYRMIMSRHLMRRLCILMRAPDDLHFY